MRWYYEKRFYRGLTSLLNQLLTKPQCWQAMKDDKLMTAERSEMFGSAYSTNIHPQSLFDFTVVWWYWKNASGTASAI